MHGGGGRGGGVEARDVVGVRHSSNISTALMRSLRLGLRLYAKCRNQLKNHNFSVYG